MNELDLEAWAKRIVPCPACLGKGVTPAFGLSCWDCCGDGIKEGAISLEQLRAFGKNAQKLGQAEMGARVSSAMQEISNRDDFSYEHKHAFDLLSEKIAAKCLEPT